MDGTIAGWSSRFARRGPRARRWRSAGAAANASTVRRRRASFSIRAATAGGRLRADRAGDHSAQRHAAGRTRSGTGEKGQFRNLRAAAFRRSDDWRQCRRGLSGPRRQAVGAARDFLLGVQVIDGRGELLTFGGQVMKNVAGYDVARLMCGSLGTLAVLAEVSLKVLPQPVAEASLRFEMDQATALRRLNEWVGSRCRSPLRSGARESSRCACRVPALPSRQPLRGSAARSSRAAAGAPCARRARAAASRFFAGRRLCGAFHYPAMRPSLRWPAGGGGVGRRRALAALDRGGLGDSSGGKRGRWPRDAVSRRRQGGRCVSATGRPAGDDSQASQAVIRPGGGVRPWPSVSRPLNTQPRIPDHADKSRRIHQGYAGGPGGRIDPAYLCALRFLYPPPVRPTSCWAMSWMDRAAASHLIKQVLEGDKPPKRRVSTWIAA